MRAEMGATAVTARVFWAVTAVTAVTPCTPCAANVLRSACRPAPPPESLPAMVTAVGRSRRRSGRRGSSVTVPREPVVNLALHRDRRSNAAGPFTTGS